MSIKYLIITISFVIFTGQSFSQTEVGATLGTSLYGGNLSKTPFIVEEAKPAGSLFGKYYINDKIAVGGSLSFGTISGDDLNKETSYKRNLRFESDIFEIAAIGSYDILDSYTYSLIPYVYAGGAFFHHNPKTEYNGSMVELQPLGTEGQGLEGYDEKYDLWCFSIPFGGGLKYKISDEFLVHADVGARKTFTKYLDDVGSELYAVPSELLAGNGQVAYDLAYRAGEIPTEGEYPGTGVQYDELEDPQVRAANLRSTSQLSDWYYLIGIGGSYSFGGGRGTKSKIPKNRKHVPYEYSRY